MKQSDVIAAELAKAAPKAWYLYNGWPMHCNNSWPTIPSSVNGITVWKCNQCGATINNADLPAASNATE